MQEALSEAIGFVAKVDEVEDPAELSDDFRKQVEPLGLSAFVCSGFLRSNKPSDAPLEYDVMVNELPPGFLESFQSEFQDTDASSRILMRTHKPFVWSRIAESVGSGSGLNDSLKKIGEIAHSFDLYDGICVPVHHSGGYVGAVGIAGKDPRLSKEDEIILQMMSIHFHDRVLELATDEDKAAQVSEDRPALSPREKECVKWVAEGKTDWDIGEILGISQSTAHFHVENAKKKLKVPTRVQLVVRAIRLGEIEI